MGGPSVWQRVTGRIFDKRRLLVGASVAGIVAAALVLRWGAGPGFLVGLLVASVTGLVPCRFSIAAGCALLACCPLLVFAERFAWLQQSPYVNYYAANAGIITLGSAVNEVATWAFYLFCIGLAARLVHYLAVEKIDDGV